jgi:hypothetical protein
MITVCQKCGGLLSDGESFAGTPCKCPAEAQGIESETKRLKQECKRLRTENAWLQALVNCVRTN